jgi:hypothetical protein
MKPLACVLACACVLAGCAVGSITRPDGVVLSGVAFGHSELEYCVPSEVAPAPAVTDVKPTCSHIKGGALSTTAGEAIAYVLTAVAAWMAAP